MTLKEINAKKAELRSKIDSVKTQEELTELRSQIEELEKEVPTEEVKTEVEISAEEERKLINQPEVNKVEERNLTKVNLNKEERKMELNKDNVLASEEYKNAWAKKLLCRGDLNEREKRALGVALTTTATEYVEPTTDVDGVNNGGLFIPESVSLSILKEIELSSPFLADVAKTFIKALISFPYKVQGSGAEWQREGVYNKDESDEFATLVLTSKELSKTIRITWKLEAMAVSEFINFMVSEIAKEMREELAYSSLYGTGVLDITGATVGSIDKVEYDGTTKTATDAIGEGLLELPIRKSSGAVVYVARDVENSILFSKDSTGNYILNPFAVAGLNKIGSSTVKVDPFLKSGDILIGNADYYKMNFSEAFSVAKDVHGKCRVNDYTGYTVVGGAPIPNSFVYIKRTV